MTRKMEDVVFGFYCGSPNFISTLRFWWRYTCNNQQK